jgi:hypothetical protein
MAANVETFAVAVILAMILLLTGKFAFAEKIGSRRALSMAAGGSLAYIFVDLLPEVNAAAAMFRTTLKIPLPFEGGYGVSLAMLTGFLCFYGLAEMAPVKSEQTQTHARKSFWAHTLGYGAYIGVIGYLLVHSLSKAEESLILYAASMSLHFMLVGFGLRDLHEADYDAVGRFVLAGFCLSGWLTGVFLDLPKPLVIVLFSFVSGGVVAITGIVELPKNDEGRFVPFVLGALGYAAFLMICG